MVLHAISCVNPKAIDAGLKVSLYCTAYPTCRRLRPLQLRRAALASLGALPKPSSLFPRGRRRSVGEAEIATPPTPAREGTRRGGAPPEATFLPSARRAHHCGRSPLPSLLAAPPPVNHERIQSFMRMPHGQLENSSAKKTWRKTEAKVGSFQERRHLRPVRDLDPAGERSEWVTKQVDDERKTSGPDYGSYRPLRAAPKLGSADGPFTSP
jgi:hypothetical protein